MTIRVWITLALLSVVPMPSTAAPRKHTLPWIHKEVKIQHVHGYRVTITEWTNREDDMRSLLVLHDPRGRRVCRIKDYGAEVLFAKDLTGDGVQELVIHTWDGYGQGCSWYYVYSLGRRARCLLAYEKGENIMDSESFGPRDLDKDGPYEILTWYDALHYRYAGQAHGGSEYVPLVLGFRNGRYVEATNQYRWRLKEWMVSCNAWLHKVIRTAGNTGITRDDPAFYSIARWYASDIVFEGARTARRKLLRILPRRDHPEFLRERRSIERIVHQRFQRYSYPRAYSRRTLGSWEYIAGPE